MAAPLGEVTNLNTANDKSYRLWEKNRPRRIEQVRKRGLPQLIESTQQRGQAPLPDLFYSFNLFYLKVLSM